MKNKDQIKEFEGSLKKYRLQIVEPYDSKNRGSYFHWDREPNENDGITYDNGMKLIEQGIQIISDAVLLYAPSFQDIQNRINQTQTESDLVRNYVQRDLNFGLDYWIKIVGEGRCNKAHDFLEIFRKVTELGDDIPFAYKEGLGEMLFHQLRIEEIGHACRDYTHWTCRSLEEILQKMHVEFMRERKQEFGESLVKELLCIKYNLEDVCGDRYSRFELPAMKAQDAIRKYRVTNENLIMATDHALVLEANTYEELASLERKNKAIKDSHEQQRRAILRRIDIEPYLCS